MKFIHIFKDDKMDEINYKDKKINEIKIIKYLSKISKSQGTGDIKKLYTWEYENSSIICYGWYDGENGFENKHELPKSGNSEFIEEDSSIKKIYGDIFIFKYQNDNYIDISISDYSVFYSSQYEDYSDYDSGSDIIDEDNLSEEDNDDILSKEYEFINNDDNISELDYDNNDY